jgi:serine protease Do
LAVLKIDQSAVAKGQSLETFPVVKLGDSDSIQIGQTVVAIGNALGEFRNTVSVGVISGMGRTITASGGTSETETLDDVLQTDAAINKGNSGGPLLNLKGEVVGINTAVATDAQSIGFAIPINKAKRDIDQVAKIGKIVYPFLGVRYMQIDSQVKEDKKLSVDYGILVTPGENGEVAVTSGSAADKAGLKKGDIVLEFNGTKLTKDNPLAKLISDLKPGDKVTLKILRDGKEQILEAVLGERS